MQTSFNLPRNLPDQLIGLLWGRRVADIEEKPPRRELGEKGLDLRHVTEKEQAFPCALDPSENRDEAGHRRLSGDIRPQDVPGFPPVGVHEGKRLPRVVCALEQCDIFLRRAGKARKEPYSLFTLTASLEMLRRSMAELPLRMR